MKSHIMNLESAELANRALQRSVPKTLQVLDTVTSYWIYPSKNKHSKTVIFIHGYRGNHHGLEAIAGALDDFNVIIPDLPGFGKSTPFGSNHSIDNYVLWLGAFIKGLQLEEKPVLLGHSFGSIIASAFASNSDAIEMLILENPVSAPALKGPNAPLTKIAQAFFAMAEKLPLQAGEWLLKSWPMVRGMSIVMTKTWNRQLRAWVHAQHDQNFNDFANRRVVIEGYRASISTDVSEYAAGFKVPTLLIIGSRDDITSPKQQFAMAQKIQVPHSISQHMGVGHLTHYEVPAEVADDIRRFANSEQHA
jgi:pimeloyl-ACP methyl ester carboxylesterase